MDKLWYVIHMTCIGTHDKIIKNSEMKDILKLLSVFYVTLHCNNCRDHYQEFLKEHPVENYFEHASLKLFN